MALAINFASLPQERKNYLLEHFASHLKKCNDYHRLNVLFGSIDFIQQWIFYSQHRSQQHISEYFRHKDILTNSRSRVLYEEVLKNSYLLDRCKTESEMSSTFFTRVTSVVQKYVVLSQEELKPWITPSLIPDSDSIPDLSSEMYRQTFTGHSGKVKYCSMNRSNSFLASVSDDRTLRLWNVATGKEEHKHAEYKTSLTCCGWSPIDETLLFTAGHDGYLRIYRWFNGELLLQNITKAHDQPIMSCQWSPRGDRLATVSHDGSIKIWSSVNLDLQKAHYHSSRYTACCWNSDGTKLCVTKMSGSILVFETENMTIIHVLDPSFKPNSGYRKGTNDCAWSSDDRYIITASSDEYVRVWDMVANANTYKFTEHLALHQHVRRVMSCAWLDTNRYFISGAYDGILIIWDLTNGQAVDRLSTHTKAIEYCGSSLNKVYFFAASQDNNISLWNFSLYKEKEHSPRRTISTTFCRWHPSRQIICLIGSKKTARIHYLAQDSRHKTIRHNQRIAKCVWSPTGRYLATTGFDQTVRIWETDTARSVHVIQEHRATINDCAWSSDETLLVMVSGDYTGTIWNITTGECVDRQLIKHSTEILCCVWRQDTVDSFILTGSADQSVKLWDINKKTLARLFLGHTDEVTGCLWLPDGHIMSVSLDKTLICWHPITGEMLFQRLFDDPIYDISLSPNGKMISLACRESLLLVNPANGDLITGLRTPSVLSSCSWNPNGKGITVTSNSGVQNFKVLE